MKKRLAIVVVAVAALLLSLAAAPVLGGGGNGLEKAKEAQKRLNEKVLSKQAVVGTAIGRDSEGTTILRVFTEKHGVAGIPKKQDDFSVSVKVTGPITALNRLSVPVRIPTTQQATTTRWPRPVPIGVSTGHPSITAGTIGARVTDGSNVYALSNNHVYADENNAILGDTVIQLGTYDGGSLPDDRIGALSDFQTINFNNRGKCLKKGRDCNTIDAAIALSSTGEVGVATPAGGYGTPSSTTVQASVRQAVQKFGRTTSTTTGEVTGINATINIGYTSGSALFVNQVLVENAGAVVILGGDSGSLLVTDPGKTPVGLLYAGSSDGTLAIANPIDAVLDRFGVTIDEGSAGTEPTPTPGPTATPVPPTPTPTPTPTPDPTGSENMRLSAIDIVHKTKGRGALLNTVTVVDASDDSPISGATVDATLSRTGASWNFSGSTNDNGQVTFKLKFPLSNTEYTLCVDSVSHTHNYAENLNLETCDSLTTQ